jgi:hypothetical protein
MSEMKNGSTDPKVIAATILARHGQDVDLSTVAEITYNAVCEHVSHAAFIRIRGEVWDRIADAEIIVRWDDDDDDGITSDVSDATDYDGT